MMCIYDSYTFLLKYNILSMYSYRNCSIKINVLFCVVCECLAVLSYSMPSSWKLLDHLKYSVDQTNEYVYWTIIVCYVLDWISLLYSWWCLRHWTCYANPASRMLRYCFSCISPFAFIVSSSYACWKIRKVISQN
jgi:hypothetical protein